ncbi:hypothetical protein GCM10009737_15880 [Nocardioides lentus]|uniref:Secreted protein n=1 Tax=Nocardioides lentus TaxID=338077 RepID=A0ABN2P8M8_9ACTN
MRLVPLLATAAASAVLVGGLAAPASAATQNRTDQAGDATTFPSDFSTAQDSADIRTLRGVHGDGALVFTFTVADLIAPGIDNSVNATVRIQTPNERDYLANLNFGEGQKSLSLVSNEQQVACDGLTGRAVAAQDRLVISVPRSCVRNPREVVFGGQTSMFVTFGTGGGQASDDARRNRELGEIKLGTVALKNN